MRAESERALLVVEVAAYLRLTVLPKKVVERVLEKGCGSEEGDDGR